MGNYQVSGSVQSRMVWSMRRVFLTLAWVLAGSIALSACSGRSTAAVVPTDLKPVSYLGLTIDVPSTWTVFNRADEVCGVRGPVVLRGPPPSPEKIARDCPAVPVVGTVVTLGGPDPPFPPSGAQTHRRIHGLEAVQQTYRDGIQGATGSGNWTFGSLVRRRGFTPQQRDSRQRPCRLLNRSLRLLISHRRET